MEGLVSLEEMEGLVSSASDYETLIKRQLSSNTKGIR